MGLSAILIATALSLTMLVAVTDMSLDWRMIRKSVRRFSLATNAERVWAEIMRH